MRKTSFRASESELIARHSNVGRYTGGLYDGVEIPRTRAEARAEAEILLGVLRDETQELYDTMEPMEQIWSNTLMQKINDNLMELRLYISMMSDVNRA